VSTVSRYGNFVCKPITSSHKPILTSLPLSLEAPTQDRRAKSDRKAVVFVKHLADVFQLHEQETDEDMLAFLNSPALSVAPIRCITPKEIKDEMGILNVKKAPGIDFITPKC